MSPVVFFSCWKWLAQFYFFKKYPNEAYLLYQPCWAATLSRRGEFHLVCPEMGCTFLKHIKPGISSNFFHYKILHSIDFYAWTIIWILYLYKLIFKIVWMWIDISGLKTVDRTEICKKNRILFNRGHNMGCNANKEKMGSKKFLRISKWVVHY